MSAAPAVEAQGRDPNAALLSRPKLKKAPKRKHNVRKAAGAAAGSPSTNGAADGDPSLDDLADQLNSALDDGGASLSPESSKSPRSSTAASSTASDSTRSRGGSLGSKLASIGDEIKDALNPAVPKRNRHRHRLAKRAAAEQQVKDNARQEVAQMDPSEDQGKIEDRGIREACRALNVDMIEMNPDGHCLFSAVADQLNLHHAPATPFTPHGLQPTSDPFSTASSGPATGLHTYASCRKSAAAYMRAHQADFLPYLPGEDDGGDGLMSEAEYSRHCDLVERTAEWGGEPEILALSRCFRYPIHVVQANSPMVKIGDEDFLEARGGRSLLISYHRTSYGLGEHYNSLRPKVA